MQINNIYCIGRNYKKHALELGNEVPEAPLVFSKPTSALAKADGSRISFPGDRGEIHHELEIVLYVGNKVDEGFTVDDVVTHMALGIDFTLRDVQSKLKKKGHPWLIAKGFRNAAIVTDFWDFPGVEKLKETDFYLQRNGDIVQEGNIQSVIFDFQTLLEYIHQEIGLNEGDIIYTGTPEGVGPIADSDEFALKWGEEIKGTFVVGKN
ncbi:fumarylacetoacetate hydrolase family protein [Oceanobacillus luteolus]|uniref:Fumarylacetoacetate hydrolase family protein n=1 Tax=Oceanobacillus luteolus TaxID=1274358 RepID=A0ABW4HUK7_9BACI